MVIKKNLTNYLLFLVSCEDIPFAAYPHRKQAEVYSSGFSKPTLIVEYSHPNRIVKKLKCWWNSW